MRLPNVSSSAVRSDDVPMLKWRSSFAAGRQLIVTDMRASIYLFWGVPTECAFTRRWSVYFESVVAWIALFWWRWVYVYVVASAVDTGRIGRHAHAIPLSTAVGTFHWRSH